MNRRGIFFTFIVIAIISLFLISYTFFSSVSERQTTQNRVETMNSFIFSVEQDLERQMFISGFRIIFLFEKHIIENGNYIANINSSFDEAFFNGTIGGQTSEEISLLMNGVTFSNITENIRQRAEKLNIDLTLKEPRASIFQEDPWSIKVSLVSNFSAQDLGGLASWNKIQESTAEIPIQGFEDPIYFLNTGGTTSSIINKSQHSSINQSNLLEHATASSYVGSTEAPSFLDRLEGSLNSESLYGIESLVNVPSLQFSKSDASIVDHEYFLQNPASGSQVSGMPSWVLIDSSHCADYQLSCT